MLTSFRSAVLALLALLIAVLGLRLYTVSMYRAKVVSVHEAPTGRVAVVFGAGILASGEPSPVLQDRVATAADLYRRGTVARVLLSGDGTDFYYDEPEAMRRAILRLGVPDNALILDHEGIRTQETCRRAREAFGVTSATLVTQAFHLPRALLLCESFGIDVVGIAGDRRTYSWRWRVSWQARETAATAVAWLEVGARMATRYVPVQ